MVSKRGICFFRERTESCFPSGKLFAFQFCSDQISHRKNEVRIVLGDYIGGFLEAAFFAGFEFLRVADDGKGKSAGAGGKKRKNRKNQNG